MVEVSPIYMYTVHVHVKRKLHKIYIHRCMYIISLVTQPPKTHTKKGSGNIVYELSQTLECSMTNQIALFAINVQSAQFIMKILLRTCRTRVWHHNYGGACVHKGSVVTSSMQKTSNQSSDHFSTIFK